MTTHSPSPVRLEKAATDTGFDLPGNAAGSWMVFASSQAPLRVWLTASSGDGVVVALSMLNVAHAMGGYGKPAQMPLPEGAVAARAMPSVEDVHRFLRRAFGLARTLPDELLHTFKKETAALPVTTEAERLVVVRVGQNIFRGGLLDYWERKCAITGLGQTELLRASHIKPWAACATDAERLDVFNGLLLAPHLDALFDGGFITVADDGAVVVSAVLKEEDRVLLGLKPEMRVEKLADGHRVYLNCHRETVFRKAPDA
ncbi:MAG: HNH endonuclease [Deltaproteobacteria bacterium]|nr:HNH endonuclease [Deltaproteobacteria bacterium]